MNFEQSQVWRALSDDAGNYYCQASESERKLFRDWIKSILHTEQVQVTFVKADGTERTMPCTLQESQLPKSAATESQRKQNTDICVVFDPERQVWRSFRWDRLKRIKFSVS
jgi:hypothetical protein